MSQRLISRSPDLKKLRDEGYDIEVCQGYLVVRDVPYVDSNKTVRRGVFSCALKLSGDVTAKPDDHVVHFSGQYPCNNDGKPLETIRNESVEKKLLDGLVIQHSFSNKPEGGDADFHQKMTRYVTIVSAYAEAIDPNATAKTHPVVSDIEEEPMFEYIDTASSRANIVHVAKKLEKHRIAIVGLGGTGSYVLDLVAKTPVSEIHLFDDDTFSQHNAFRSPGAAAKSQLAARPKKVEYLKAIYSNMHRGIVPHAARVDASNIDQVTDKDFVFLCLDAGEPKRLLVERLEGVGRSFVDVGMGINLVDEALGGIVRTTTSTPKFRGAKGRMALAGGEDDEYEKNIQVADLNALNAVMAVIKWKKLLGFYHDFEHEHDSTYSIDVNMLTNEEQHED
jgi:hypothetical protein